MQTKQEQTQEEKKLEEENKQLEEEQHTDIITQLQNQLNQISYLFFGLLSGISSEAPPQPVIEQLVEIEDAPTELNQEIKDIPQKIMTVSKQFQDLVQQLPDMTESEVEQIQAIISMQKRNEELKIEVEKELLLAKNVQRQQQQLTLMLAEKELQYKQQ
eukprot:TRINITY_DN14820_c0_g1_i2.p2 TRINITY_DN14820_c0_g1~~TRINITY_DN14820_c0_g1_i2.p2  ORF type:complete len:173 (-),score=32.04 TRINITY_DN14820_c0_g1_i2:454-930(-)